MEKLGITLNLRTERGKELLAELVPLSNAVTENFAAGVMDRLGFGYERLRELRPDIVYVSNCGFGHTGPYRSFKSWGPIAQAVSGLTHTSGLPQQEPAGWGYSYMDHTGGYFMAIALLAALYHQRRTGEGQWVDLACAEAGVALNGPATLDAIVNGRDERADGAVHSNRSRSPAMAPHGIYPCRDDDSWVAIACRHDDDWHALAGAIGEPWAKEPAYRELAGRLDGAGRAGRSAGSSGPVSAVVTRSWPPCRRPACPVRPCASPPERCDADAEPTRPGACGPRSGTPSTAPCGSTGYRCTCRGPTGASSAAGPCWARTTSASTPRCWGCRRPRSAAWPQEGVI